MLGACLKPEILWRFKILFWQRKKNPNFNILSESSKCWNGKNINAVGSECLLEAIMLLLDPNPIEVEWIWF